MMVRRQSGEYRCEASNGYADNAVTSQAVNITVMRELDIPIIIQVSTVTLIPDH